MFKKHWDEANQQWNVYLVTNGTEEYVCSFGGREDGEVEAQKFCDEQNAIEVEMRR